MKKTMNQHPRRKFPKILTFVLAIALLLPLFPVQAVLGNSELAENGDRTFRFDKSEMAGKAFVFYGDSITAGLGVPDAHKRYIDLLQDEFGFYAYNGAVSGASLTQVETSTNDIYSQLKVSEYLYRDADYVSIFLGTNDFGMNRPLGTPNDEPDTGTVCASLKNVLDTIIAANPDVKIMLLTPLYRQDGNHKGFTSKNGADYTLGDVRDAIKAIGAEYRCKVVDLSSVVGESNYTTMLNADKLHVQQAGYEAIAKCIKNS